MSLVVGLKKADAVSGGRLVRIWKRALPLAIAAVGISCGDVYRPVAIPIAGPSPNPQPTHYIFSISSNGASAAGSMSRIDVSGDSVLTTIPSGAGPAYAALAPNGSTLYVANSGEDTVSLSPSSLSAQPTTIDLVSLCDSSGCPPVMPVFVASTESNRMYVADEGNGTISVIDTVSNAVARTVAVNPAFSANPPGQPLPLPDRNARPVALTELPNGSKVYSVNQGNNTVTSINTVDDSIARVLLFGSAPIWAVASADGTHIYVLDASGTVSVVDTLSDTIVGTIPAGSGANYMLYDKASSRLYVTVANGASPLLQIYDVAGSTLVSHGAAPVAITAAPGSPCSSNPVPTSVAVLGDGSRAYVSSYQADPTQICTQATVVDANSGSATKTIALTTAPDNSSQTGCSTMRFRTYATASGGGTGSNFKVYVAQCDAGTMAVIYTYPVSTGADPHPADVFLGIVPSPVSSFGSSQVSVSGATFTAATDNAPATTTYTYSLLSGPSLLPGMTVYVSGMTDGGNNGTFAIQSVTSSNFTVANASGVTSQNPQSGSGSVLPSQNPVFLVAGP